MLLCLPPRSLRAAQTEASLRGTLLGAALGHLQAAVSPRAAWPLFRAVCRQRGVVAVLH